MKRKQLVSSILFILIKFISYFYCQSSNADDILLLSASPITTLELKQYQSGMGYHLALSNDGKYVFISCLTGGFLIFDISNPLNPQYITQFQGYDVRQIELDDQYAYIIDGVLGLCIYDIQNMLKIIPISQLQFAESVTSIKRLTKSETLLVVGNGILFSVDISDKAKPTIVSQAGVDKSISYQIVVNKGETHAFVSQGQLGVGIYNISNVKSLVQILLQRPYWIVFYTVLHPDEEVLYVVDGWYGLFSTDITAAVSSNPPSPNQLVFNAVAQFPGNVIVGAILSDDSKYLVISLKSIGFKMYDISVANKKMQPDVVYQLEGSYFMRSFTFSKNNQYFYLINGIQLVIHEKVVPNLNNDFPNVFNTYQSTLTFLGNEFWPYHIHIFKDGKTAAVNVGLIGTKLYDISDIDHPVLLSTINSISNTSQDYVYAQPSNENILYVGGSQLGIHIFDITNKKQPNLITTYAPNANLENNCDGLDMNDDRTIVIVGNSDQGISIADFSDLQNPQKHTNWPSLFNSNVKKVKLSKDNKYAYLASLEVGLIVLDVSIPKEPKMISVVNQMVGETPNMSIDEKHIFLANGFSGLTIINIENPYQPYIISSIAVDGWVMNMFTMFNEKYIVACTAEKGQITVVDISDQKNPYIFAKYSNIDEHSFSIASTPDYSAAIFIGAKGMRILPLKTKLYIHSQFKELVVSSDGKQTSRNMNVGESLKVGSTVYITFTSVYSDREIVYQDALYYQNYEIKRLPSNMQFISSQKLLIIEVSKEGVTNNIKGENIVLLQLSAQVSFKDVMKIHPAISTELAFGIVQCLVQASYLDQQQFLDPSFNPVKSFYLDFYSMLNIPKQPFALIDQLIQNGLHSLLKYSKIQYPIRFFVQSSLTLNKKLSLNQVVQTPSKNVEIFLNIITPQSMSKPSGVFIKKSFQGVLAVYSDSLDQLKLEGSLSNVNMILNQNIQIANLTALENIQIKYTISDGSNFDIENQDSLNNLYFLTLNKPVKLNKKIQQQLNSQFSDSGLYVAEQFSFKLDSQTFIDLDAYNTNLIYSAYFVNSSDEEEQINETTDKIQFNSREIVIKYISK